MKAIATLIEDKIAVKTQTFSAEEFEDALARCKAVGGGRWSKESKVWRYPLNLDTCHRLRTVWGGRLSVATPLRDWYVAENAKADHRASEASRADATLTRLPHSAPRLASTLRADQRGAAVWMGEGWRGAALLADHPGTGKTLVTIAGMLEADAKGPILVACPRLSVRPVWVRELQRWTDEPVYMARGTRAQRTRAIQEFMEDPAERKWLITVAETLRAKKEEDEETGKKRVVGFEYPELFGLEWSAVIVDESHKMFGSLTIVKGNLMGDGLKRLCIATGEEGIHRIAVSGTPFGRGGRIQGMFGTLHWLWPDEFTSFWRWADQHFEIEEQKISRTKVVKKIGKLKGGKDEEHFLRSLGPRILRRTKAEVLPNLPEKRRVDVWCEMTSAQSKQYQRLLNDGEVVGKNGMTTADGVLAFITRSKQLASGVVDVNGERVTFTDDSCKIDTLIEKMDERGLLDGTGDTKIIISSQFNELLEAVKRRLVKEGVNFFEIVGSTSDRHRDQIMDCFQSDQMKTRVLLLNAKAGGVSITLDAADELHMLDEMWDPGDNEQLEDRIHRASRIHQATIYRYRTEGTIDEGIANDVEGRRFEQHRVLDRSRGVEFLMPLVEGKKVS